MLRGLFFSSMNWVFLLIAIVIPACFTDSSVDSFANKVGSLEYAVFRNAPLGDDGDNCAAFYGGVGADPSPGSDAQQQYCNRYNNAVNCYNDLVANSKIAPANQAAAQQEFNENNLPELAETCASKK